MELLLILSAVLSVVTGAFSGVRGPEARIHQAEATVGAQVVVSTVEEQATSLVFARPEELGFTVEVLPLGLFRLAAAFPLYADRLIE